MRRHRDALDPNPLRMPRSDCDPVLDSEVLNALKELGGTDEPDLFVEIVDLFIQDAEQQVTHLQGALASGDIRLVERIAHTLKSSSANVGALRFSKLCFELEQLGRAAKVEEAAALVRDVSSHYVDVRKALEAAKV